MTPSRQFAESVKYSAHPLVLIPFEGEFLVFEAWGTSRDYLTTLPSAELAAWLRDDLTRQRSRRAARLATEAQAYRPRLILGDDPLFPSALSDFTL